MRFLLKYPLTYAEKLPEFGEASVRAFLSLLKPVMILHTMLILVSILSVYFQLKVQQWYVNGAMWERFVTRELAGRGRVKSE